MPDKDAKTGAKSLNDGDISTFARRGGPTTGTPGTDVDTHTDSDAPVAATDHDTAVHTDKDS